MMEVEGLKESKVDCAKHREEYEGRMKTDAADQSKIQDTLVTPHAENILMNSYSGEEARSGVTTKNSREIWVKEMIRF